MEWLARCRCRCRCQLMRAGTNWLAQLRAAVCGARGLDSRTAAIAHFRTAAQQLSRIKVVPTIQHQPNSTACIRRGIQSLARGSPPSPPSPPLVAEPIGTGANISTRAKGTAQTASSLASTSRSCLYKLRLCPCPCPWPWAVVRNANAHTVYSFDAPTAPAAHLKHAVLFIPMATAITRRSRCVSGGG
jgi:hypothetical protein